jgi:hypothetical protein
MQTYVASNNMFVVITQMASFGTRSTQLLKWLVLVHQVHNYCRVPLDHMNWSNEHDFYPKLL